MKIKRLTAIAVLMTILGLNTTKAQSLGDLLGGGLGNTIGNMLEGVFSSSDITIADMQGEWTSTGPAVCFQGEGFLKKAGGVAAAAAIETKLQPYYDQYGLKDAKLTIDAQGNFTLVCKMIKMNGTITQPAGAEPGVFEFNFTALGMKLASVTTYVQKTSSSMDVMFDATKLKKLLSAIAQFTGIKTVQALTQILDSYDGLCVGFHFSATGNQQNSTGSGFNLGNIFGGNSNSKSNTNSNSKSNSKSNSNSNSKSNSNSGNDSTSTGLDLLRGILGGKTK